MASDGDKKTHPNPLLKANFTRKFFFWWLIDFIWYIKKHDVTNKDLYDTIPEDQSERLACNLESAWFSELSRARKGKQKPSLWKVVIKVYCWDCIKFIAVFSLCFSATQIALPEFLGWVMSYFRPKSSVTSERAYFYGTGLLVLTLLRTASSRHGFFHLMRLGMRARTAFTSLIYKKMIRLPSSVNRKIGNHVISLLSIDVGRLELFFPYASAVLTFPLQLIIETYLIWRFVGFVATAAGVAALVLLNVPVQALYSKVALKIRAKQGKRTDDRVSLIGEIVDGMKAVKMYVWEENLEKLVQIARRLEIQNYAKLLYLESVVSALGTNSYRLGVFVVAMAYVLQYSTVITADKILPVAVHLYNLRLCMGSYMFSGVKVITDMHVSMKRIEDFLLSEEVSSSIDHIKDMGTEAISIENVTAYWDEKSIIFKDISLSFVPKKLYAIVGCVGSGKSSLLKLILRELEAVSGKVSVYGTVSYVAQEPWLFNGSVRDNILFGEKYNGDRYEQVVNVCALIDDFNQLPHGDKSLVGDRGSNLSGGQCARINLARAVYRDSDIYLFDNPLSAVDARVAKTISIDCFDGLLRDKTRILITNSVQHLDNIAEIILLEHGQVEFRGSKEDFQQNDQYITLLRAVENDVLREDAEKLQIDKPVNVHRKSSVQKGEEPKETEKLIAKGTMKMTVYSSYIKAGGLKLACLFLLINFVFIIATSAFDLGLGTRTKADNQLLKNQIEIKNNRSVLVTVSSESNRVLTDKILVQFGSLTLAICTMILKNLLFYKFALNASETIHNGIFSRMMTATLEFFGGNSAGRILNRFSEDTGVVDSVLPQALYGVIAMTDSIIAMLLPAIIVNWWIFIPCTISVYISVLMGKIYVRTIQSINRLVGSANSPIMSFATSSLAGATTIRVCRAESMVIKDFCSRQDHRSAAQFLAIALGQALSFWLEFNNFGLLAFITYLCIYLKNDATYEGHVGLALMQVLTITMTMSYAASQVAQAFAYMTSVERILQFRELEQETLIEEKLAVKITSSWPDKGEIIFEHLFLRYTNNDDPVLWDVNCVVKSGSKVGIVGRTGAGKSSLISALFRFAKIDGSILIDGVNSKSVDLYKLRSKISIIPQEPFLFEGTLRKNLDISSKYDDASLWSALESVELKDIFDSLDFSIERGGGNISAGQRQLLCLARATLIKNKILILDEVTANVDSSTDALIQKTIMNKFKECTILTIAHRLDTVIDSDKILVMDNGRVAEYDHPFVLLQNRDSYFFKMVEQTGNASVRQLTTIAKEAFDNLGSVNKPFRKSE